MIIISNRNGNSFDSSVGEQAQSPERISSIIESQVLFTSADQDRYPA